MTTTKADLTAADRILKRACTTAVTMLRDGADRDRAVAILAAAGTSAAVLYGEA